MRISKRRTRVPGRTTTTNNKHASFLRLEHAGNGCCCVRRLTEKMTGAYLRLVTGAGVFFYHQNANVGRQYQYGAFGHCTD
ncbi:hypothetical protein I7I52_07004 [Histoplasma capsulatum]|uniref:Uncharacterized protein n=1 Tax=Ajellomyces capsulatus TaxID=5037 RepID=A0A8H8D0F7_AJECA|nr:hypothetical protein I7I52_07004 [Histoplasma capsulatum]